MLFISKTLALDESELDFNYIRSPGPGGQNVNKVASGVQLRFNVRHSPSLPEDLRLRFLALFSSKITLAGDIIIKATAYRTQEGNKQDALGRLKTLILQAAVRPKKRKKTKPSFAATQRRLSKKKLHGRVKALRGKRGQID